MFISITKQYKETLVQVIGNYFVLKISLNLPCFLGLVYIDHYLGMFCKHVKGLMSIPLRESSYVFFIVSTISDYDWNVGIH